MQPNNGSTSGLDLSLAGEIGYDFHAGLVTHGPIAGFILQQARINGFTESGSFTSLSFASQTRNSEVSTLGYQARLDWGILHPFAQVVWDHEFDPLNRVVIASLTTTAAPSYRLPAVVLGRDWATTTVGTNVTFDRSWSGNCFVHSAARPKSRARLWRPRRARLLVRARAASSSLVQKVATCPRKRRALALKLVTVVSSDQTLGFRFPQRTLSVRDRCLFRIAHQFSAGSARHLRPL